MPSKKTPVKESKTNQKKKKSPSVPESKSKSRSKSKSSSSHGSNGSSETIKSAHKSLSKKKPASNKSVGVGSRMKSLSSHRSAYKQSVGRTVNAKPSTGGSSSTVVSVMYTQKYGREIYDTIQLLLSCPLHQKVALTAVGEGKRLYLPFYPIKHGQTWVDAVGQFLLGKLLRENLAKIGGSTEAFLANTSITAKPVLVELLRTQLPVYFDFVHRATFRVELTAAACKAKMCADNSLIGWYPAATFRPAHSPMAAFFGPEPLLLKHFFSSSAEGGGRLENVREVTITELFRCPLLEELREVKPGYLLGTCNAKDEVLRVYGDFLQQVSPSQFMTASSFADYLKQSRLKITVRVDALFAAFAANGLAYLSFEEFIIGLLIVGRLSPPEASEGSSSSTSVGHSAPSATTSYSAGALQAIADFVFRFYAFPNDDKLNSSQLHQAAKDGLKLCTTAQQPSSSMSKDKFRKAFIEHCLPAIQGFGSGRKRLKTFELVGQWSPMQQLHLRLAHPVIRRREQNADESKAVIEAKLNTLLLCENCHAKKYALSPYNLKLSLDGHLYEPVENKEEDVKAMKTSRRIRTEHYFHADFSCNLAMDMIRAYAIKLNIFPTGSRYMKNAAGDIPDWTQQKTRVEYLKKKLPKIFDKAKEVLSAEHRVVKVSSPAYVFGDLHGNLEDLLTFEQAIWKDGIFSNPVNLVFLGDYVDVSDMPDGPLRIA